MKPDYICAGAGSEGITQGSICKKISFDFYLLQISNDNCDIRVKEQSFLRGENSTNPRRNIQSVTLHQRERMTSM